MLIDKSQNKGHVTVSYCDGGGIIKVKNLNVEKNNGFGFYEYEICDEKDPDKEPKLRHYLKDRPIKKVSSWKFDFDGLREFLTKSLDKEFREKLFSFNMPDLYMVDIEIDIKDGDVFPDPKKAEFPIDSIQITSPDFKTIVLSTNEKVLQDEKQMKRVQNIIENHYKDNETVKNILKGRVLEYAHMKFETEQEMVTYFWKMVRQKLHYVSFWNGSYFDVPYLDNRCKEINVDMSIGSPTDEISSFNRWPKHRYVDDYMKIVEKFGKDLEPMQSTGLDYISNKAIKARKIGDGESFKELFFGDVKKYLAYGAVDTINMQLIHQKKKYTSANEVFAYYTKTSMFETDRVTSQVNALCWDELYSENKINAEPYVKKNKADFEGGYVKKPTRKFAIFPTGIDFSALYPRLIQSYNLSFENYIGKVKDADKKKKLIENGYMVSVNNNVYKNDKDYSLKRMETKLLNQRYSYKNLMKNMYLKAIPTINEEIKKRGLETKNN